MQADAFDAGTTGFVGPHEPTRSGSHPVQARAELSGDMGQSAEQALGVPGYRCCASTVLQRGSAQVENVVADP